MRYKNLKVEMVIRGYTINDLARITGKSRNAISKNMNVAGSFTVEQAIAIKKELFPELTIDYLFARADDVA